MLSLKTELITEAGANRKDAHTKHHAFASAKISKPTVSKERAENVTVLPKALQKTCSLGSG